MQRRTARVSTATAWMILFVAVLAHMPALKGYFAQDDWNFLARGSGEAPASLWSARPLGSVLYWRLTWPLFGAAAPGYHAAALLIAALSALLAARVGSRLGLGRVGAAVSGLAVATSPLVILPIFWVSATQELLAVALALLCLEFWFLGSRWRWAALCFACLSFAAKEGALGVWVWLALAPLLGCGSHSRVAWAWLAPMAVVAAVAGFSVWAAIPHQVGDAYALGGPGTVARNLALFGGWLLSPVLAAGESSLPLWLGPAIWLGWGGAAWIFWQRQRDGIPALALLWTLLGLLPVLALRDHLFPYYLCSALIGWAWFLGWLAERALPARWSTAPIDNTQRVSWIAACLFCAIFGWTTTGAYLGARNEEGLHRDPLVRRSAIAASTKRLIHSLPLRSGSHLAILQATTLELPAETEPGLLVASPVFLALSGPIGLARIVPEGVDISWASHLDDAPMTAQVLLDDGAPFLRPLGDTSNARIYSALIAVAGGQFARARHDFWNVVGPLGSQVRWAYDSDALPVAVDAIQRHAPDFAQYLIDSATPSDGRILRTFEQVYEALTGEALLRAPWGDPVRG